MAFGSPMGVRRAYDKAQVILALDSDFLGQDAVTVLPTKQFSKGRKVHNEEDFEKTNRLYAVESAVLAHRRECGSPSADERRPK